MISIAGGLEQRSTAMQEQLFLDYFAEMNDKHAKKLSRKGRMLVMDGATFRSLLDPKGNQDGVEVSTKANLFNGLSIETYYDNLCKGAFEYVSGSLRDLVGSGAAEFEDLTKNENEELDLEI